MTPDGEDLLIGLRDFLDSFSVPWTFAFGNHDHESDLSRDDQAEILMRGKHCYFEKGTPALRGVGNELIPKRCTLI
jgi:hypothetical protein